MPAIEFRVDDARLAARLDKITPDVRAALKAALGPLAGELAQDARAAASAHIRYLGKNPGQYLASIYGGTFDKESQVGGFVRSGDPLAHLLEYGTKDRYKKTLRTAREVLGQLRAGFTGAMPAYPAIEPVLAANEGRIRDAVEDAARRAAAGA
jgi:hypothetical protein